METSLLPSPLIFMEKGMDEGSSREGKPARKPRGSQKGVLNLCLLVLATAQVPV